MKGDLLDTWYVYDKRKKQTREIKVYEVACETCRHRYSLDVCRGASRRQSVIDKDPCVLKCSGYEYHEWAEDELAEARERLRASKPVYRPVVIAAGETDIMDELFDDSDEERRIAGFAYDEDDDYDWH